MKRYVIIGDEPALLKEMRATTGRPRAFGRTGDPDPSDLKRIVRDLKHDAEAQVIAKALQHTGGNRRQAAALLNISYKALAYKIKEYGLHVPSGALEPKQDESRAESSALI